MAEFLFVVLFILATARLFGKIMNKLGQPEVLGELLAGIGIGVCLIYLSDSMPFISQFRHICKGEPFKVLCDLGIFFLMFMAGMEMNIDKLLKASKRGSFIAFWGFCLPFVLGVWLGFYFLPESNLKMAQALFLGVALSITAIAVSVRVLMDLGQLNTALGQSIISAAVIDDLLGLVGLAILTSILEFGKIPHPVDIGMMIIKILSFFGIIIAFEKFLAPKLQKYAKSGSEIEVSVSIIVGLALACIAELAGMHFIIGAFMAGLIIRKLAGDKAKIVECKLSGLTFGLLAPIFFVSIGLHLDFSAVGISLPFLLALLGAAVFGKIIGCGIPAKLCGFSWRESLGIGIGMNGRGAVELVIAAIAMEIGLFNTPDHPVIKAVFSAIVIMAILTTLLTSMSLGFMCKKNKKRLCK